MSRVQLWQEMYLFVISHLVVSFQDFTDCNFLSFMAQFIFIDAGSGSAGSPGVERELRAPVCSLVRRSRMNDPFKVVNPSGPMILMHLASLKGTRAARSKSLSLSKKEMRKYETTLHIRICVCGCK